MTKMTANIAHRKTQNGAALVVGLLLLVVITVLAISGMNTAATELAMARNDQAYEDAFQAAETGLANALSQGIYNTNANANLQTNVNTNTNINTIAAYHFLATSQADFQRNPGNPTDRDSAATHTQAFYVVGPDSSTL